MPFDLEGAFSSAFLLYILQDISPYLLPDNAWRDNIHSILQHMVDNGSVVAPLRQQELLELEAFLASITPRLSSSSATIGTPIESGWSAPEQVDPKPDSFALEHALGPSCNDLMNWAQQLDMPDILTNIDHRD